MIYKLILQTSALFLMLLTPVFAQIDEPQPEISTGLSSGVSSATGAEFMIVTSNEHATKAGAQILERGGSAADAAIAAQAVLGLTEPQSSGLGGGAFVLYYDAKTKDLKSIDGRETAPGLASPFLFYKNGSAMNFKEAQIGGRSVGVPGIPKLLEHLHQAYGKVTWMELFEEATKLAEEGFEISPRLADMIAHHESDLAKFPDTAAYFLDADKKALTAGQLLKNSAYAKTLKDYAFYGSPIFYDSGISDLIIDKVQNAKGNPGFLTKNDFQGYVLKDRKPICGPYRTYIICSMGEPSSGALTILEALGLLEEHDLKTLGPENPKSWALIAQASALAFADRSMYMADPDFVNTPGVALIDPRYLEERRMAMDEDTAIQNIRIEAGKPPLWDGPLYERGNSLDRPGTSHISVIDGEGNILSMTTTVESAFGSHLMAGGFILNNELTDFSFEPFGANGELVANMVEGGKRPRSSMSPTIVFDLDGKPVLVIGSAGGSRIIGYVLQRLIAVLDWNMPIDEALAAKHILARGAQIEIEEGSALAENLKAAGNAINIGDLNSGLTAIHIHDDTYTGAADPRREGLALGK